MIYICKPSKVAIYVNSGKKSAAKIKAETGCTALINGGLYTRLTYKPVCHLKVDGRVLAQDPYKYYGFAWNESDLTLTNDYTASDNFICCVCLVKDGKPEPLYYNSDLAGNRPRTAMGVFDDGQIWLYANKNELLTPEQLQEKAIAAGLKHALMLDGGGSTQGISPTETVSSTRRVHNYICVWASEPVRSPQSDNLTGGGNMFKIALGAGHGIDTPGKRCLKSLDPNETREWWLNDRVCDYIEEYLSDYEGYELLRLDDSDDGADNIALESRVKMANDFGADVYISIHHNAGANGTDAGGIVAYSYPNSAKGAEWRDELYDTLIAYTGLKGNRAEPKQTANFYVLKHSKMVSTLLELGFMDSRLDVPIILTNAHAKKCAKAITEIIVKRGKLKKKEKQTGKEIYRVQVGAFSVKENADNLKAELIKKGYPAYVTKA